MKIKIPSKKSDLRKLFGLGKFKKPIKEIKNGHNQEWKKF